MMKKYFIFVFAYFILLLSFVPNFYEASVTNLLPPDRTMVWGEHNYTYDHNVYLSKIRQGQEGRLSVVDKYDNHPNQKGVFLQMFYLLSGKITKIFGLSPILSYHLLRTVMAVFWIIIIILLNFYFLKKLTLINLGVVLSLLTASFPLFYRFENQWWIGQYMGWWQELDILKRISFIPHDTFNYISISVLSILLGLMGKNKSNKYFIVICFLLFISVLIQPSSALLFLVSWTLYHTIIAIWSGSLDKDKIIKLLKQTFVIFITILTPILYIKMVTSTYPWKSLLDFDQKNRLSVNIKEYILTLGPVFFTGIAGLILVLFKKKQELLSLVTWIIGVSVLLILFKFFPYQSELRFIQTANHIPLAILSAYLFHELWKKAGTRISVIKVIIVITVIMIILNGLTQSYFSLKSQTQFINQRALATLPLVPYPPQVMYPLNDFYNGLKWLEINTNHQTVVLSKITAGNYIPAYSGNFVYLGHSGETPDYDIRTEKVNEFFSGSLPGKQALKFLKTENISYVFYGPQEKENNLKDISIYSFLTPVYQTPLVTIYKIKS
ncbi:MAG: hypothetical protein UR23_C0002G0007 [Candidatus Roizmanbacteria bacterium GW2011_GWA2_32_13]|uniref:Glycosyltransferase RgtA/B/C/D-like domain-containing protein n=1 Tax=Candidatus Roizmanbacteria bacterium GW2011_GWA2_32_13 TaxID=1618475 RepID=A0A0G0C2S9_9BACT|nr:MAG: hypothetical protein UR23_C0002G0007 [Candidatus Roizmanbacteria bacterium GW2011_GWA2_32_13]